MIGEITDNIIAGLINKGLSGKDDIQDTREIIIAELGKYEISRKETSLVIYDKTDTEIVARFFLAKATAGLSDKSLKYYRRVLEGALPKLGKRLNDVKADDIRAYLTMRRIQGVTNTSIDNERRVLSSFFNFSHDEEYIEHNPMKRIEKVKTQKLQKKPFTEDEMERLRMAAKTDRNKAVIEFLYSTACRVSEVEALDISDIDFDQRECTVLGKGNKERKVFLSPRCISVLKHYLSTRKDKHPALFVTDTSKYNKGKEINRFGKSGIETMVRMAGRRAGIEKAHPHRIRRTAATLALRRGMPIEQVSKMLGHEDLKTTTIYASSTMDEVKQSHDKYLV